MYESFTTRWFSTMVAGFYGGWCNRLLLLLAVAFLLLVTSDLAVLPTVAQATK